MAAADPLSVGSKAPDFTLADEVGRRVRLSELRGRPVVLFFYPEDDTPVCTQQACGFRDEHARFAAAGAVVLGVSPDDAVSHRAFKAKFSFPYALLSDPGNKVATRYGAFGEKLMYGKKVQGTIRSSVLVDAQGRVAGVWRSVRSAGNGARMADAVETLTRAGP